MYLLTTGTYSRALFEAARARGDDISLLRNDSHNIVSMAAQQGNIPLLQWLTSIKVSPLPATDPANELAKAMRSISDRYPSGRSSSTAFDWLLDRGYSWPEHVPTAHRLLLQLAWDYDDARLAQAGEAMRKSGVLAQVLKLDESGSDPQLIFSAKTAQAVALMERWGVDIHAKQKKPLGRANPGYDAPNALFRWDLSADTQRALLERGVSAISPVGYQGSMLVNAITRFPADLSLIEMYLRAGVDASGYGDVSVVHEVARSRQPRLSADLQHQLLKLLIRYGANPFAKAPHLAGVRDDSNVGLPIHIAILTGNLEFFSPWLQESGAPKDIRHPNTQHSLIGFVLASHSTYSLATGLMVAELARLGAPVNPTGEAQFALALRGRLKPSYVVLEQLMALGVDINAIDHNTGVTPLAELLTKPAYLSCPGPSCTRETREERLALLRWLVSRGASPHKAWHHGKSALDLAAELPDPEKRAAYEAALLNR